MRHCFSLIVLLIGSAFAWSGSPEHPWNLRELSKPPATFPGPAEVKSEGVQTLFYEGEDWNGKPTRVFAFVGIPAEASAAKKVPGMVLVHGGGGTAFAEWVRLWNSRGYAAIAMDTCGAVPLGKYGAWQRHEAGGPPGWGGFHETDQPKTNHWVYHAVSAVIRGHSLLESLPEVDAKRIGITGISWGGYLTCISASVDPRFEFAVPVYGCGFLGSNSVWLKEFAGMGPEKSAKWLKDWDPSEFLREARMPFLWVTGTTDFAYPLDSLQKSYHLPKTKRTLAIRVNMPHAHGGAGENPQEIHTFANSFCKKEPPLATFRKQDREGKKVWATFQSPVRIEKAELNYTTDNGPWEKRQWKILPAELEKSKVSAELPDGVTVYYLNIFDDRKNAISTEHQTLP